MLTVTQCNGTATLKRVERSETAYALHLIDLQGAVHTGGEDLYHGEAMLFLKERSELALDASITSYVCYDTQGPNHISSYGVKRSRVGEMG